MDDWSCIKGPPAQNQNLPGLRYGASIEMRPLTMLLPCPCAGGVVTPPHADDGAELDASGLWHDPQDRYPRSAIAGLPQPVISLLTHPPPFAPEVEPYDPDKKAKAAAEKAGEPTNNLPSKPQGNLPTSGLPQASPTNMFAESTDGEGGAADHKGSIPLKGVQKARPFKESFILPDSLTKTYFPGSEPYSMDYGCAEAAKQSPYQVPGKRWKDTAMWTAVAVPTPCPCALGTFSTLQAPEANHVPPVPDSVFVTPGLGALSGTAAAPWQGNSSYLMGNMGASAVVLALASSALLSPFGSRQSCSSHDATAARPAPARGRTGGAFL